MLHAHTISAAKSISEVTCLGEICGFPEVGARGCNFSCRWKATTPKLCATAVQCIERAASRAVPWLESPAHQKRTLIRTILAIGAALDPIDDIVESAANLGVVLALILPLLSMLCSALRLSLLHADCWLLQADSARGEQTLFSDALHVRANIPLRLPWLDGRRPLLAHRAHVQGRIPCAGDGDCDVLQIWSVALALEALPHTLE